jgi:hypothetical protein
MRSVSKYQRQWYSSGVAFGGGLIGWRSSTRGLRSIISVWERSVSMTVWREMPAGRGVRVVKMERFDILNYWSNLVDIYIIRNEDLGSDRIAS